MRTIYKYPMSKSVDTLELPVGAHLLRVDMQQDTPTLWALVDPEASKENIRIAILGTGHQYPETDDEVRHINTFFDGPFVWHAFDLSNSGS